MGVRGDWTPCQLGARAVRRRQRPVQRRMQDDAGREIGLRLWRVLKHLSQARVQQRRDIAGVVEVGLRALGANSDVLLDPDVWLRIDAVVAASIGRRRSAKGQDTGRRGHAKYGREVVPRRA